MSSNELVLRDQFDDEMLSGYWHPVSRSGTAPAVEESGGSLTLEGGSSTPDGLNGNLFFAPNFECEAVLDITAGDPGDWVAVGGRGDIQLDTVPADSRVYVSIDVDGPIQLHLEDAAGSQSTTVSKTQGAVGERYTVTLQYDPADDRVSTEVEGQEQRNTAALDASGADWVSLAPWAASSGATLQLDAVEATGRAGFGAPFEVQDFQRVVHQGLVTDKPSEPHYPKEAAAVQDGETIYLAIAGFDGYECVEGENTFVSGRVTEKDVTLWRGSEPLGEFEQIGVVTDEPAQEEFDPAVKAGYQHAPAIGILDGELWVLYNQRVADEIHARHAPVDDIPARPAGWTHEVLAGDASDVKTIVRHDGRVHVVCSNAEFTEAHVISGPELTDLRDRTTIVSVDDGYPAGVPDAVDAIVAPHVLPGPDGGWFLVLERRLGEGYTDYGGAVLLYSDTLRGRYHPRGATNEADPAGRPGTHPDVWMAPGRVGRQVLPDRESGYVARRAGHAVFCYEAGQRELATREGAHFGYFEGETDRGFHVLGFTS